MCCSPFDKPSYLNGTVVVGEMTVLREYTLLEIQRIGSGAEHIFVVICFDKNKTAAGKRLIHLRSDVTEICTYSAVFVVGGMYSVSAALNGIVRRVEAGKLRAAAGNGDSVHVDDIGGRSDLSGFVETLESTLLTVYGHSRLFCQHSKTGSMIAVFVGDEYRTDCGKRDIIDSKNLGKLPEAHTAVDENAFFFCSDERGISFAGAEKGVNSCHAVKNLSFVK